MAMGALLLAYSNVVVSPKDRSLFTRDVIAPEKRFAAREFASSASMNESSARFTDFISASISVYARSGVEQFPTYHTSQPHVARQEVCPIQTHTHTRR